MINQTGYLDEAIALEALFNTGLQRVRTLRKKLEQEINPAADRVDKAEHNAVISTKAVSKRMQKLLRNQQLKP